MPQPGANRKIDPAPGSRRGLDRQEKDMRASEGELDIELEVDGIVTRGEDWGGQIMRHLTLPPGVDFTPLFKGLPGDMCQCPHWGYVLSGSIHLRYADGTEEVMQAGDAYYWPAGHTGWTDEGVTFLEVSPAEELQPVLEHLGAQLSPAG
jgi:hypothetical protein